MSFLNYSQNSPEWLEARLGKCTASRVKDALSRLKRGEGKGSPTQASKDYLIELVTERLTGRASEHYVTPAMEWGIEAEKYAVAAYEVVSGNDTEKCGLAVHDGIVNFAASPDRTVGPDGLLETKCPTTAVHLEYLLAGEIPAEYTPQLLAQLSCTGRKYVDFVSFDPRLPARHQIFIKRLERDEAQIAALEFGVVEFLAEVDAMVNRLNGINPLQEQLRKSVALEDEAMISDDDIEWAKRHQEANR